MSDTNMLSPHLEASTEPATKERSWDEQGAQRLERQLFFALLGGVLLLVAWLGRFAFGFEEQIADIAATAGAIILVIPLARGAVKEILSGKPASDALASLAVLAAIAVGEYLAAGFLAFFLWLAELVLSRTAWGAQRAIRELVELTPDKARMVDAQGNEKEVSLSDIKSGTTVRVRPGENLPVDGLVIDGRTDINQASLTGEAIPVEALKGTEVYAGTTNLTGQIDIEVTAIAGETTIGKVEQLIREAESSKGQRQELIEKLAAYYVPVVLMVAMLVWFFTAKSSDPLVQNEAAVRAITVLVVTCPGALLIAYPTAMVAAFASAARLGIMIKQTRTLESAARVDTVVLDKTGTLTTGKFAVSRLAPSEGIEGATLLQAAADAEQSSNHPLAKSILETALKARIEPKKLSAYTEIHGRGVRAETEVGVIHAGRADWLIELDPAIESRLREVETKIEGMSGVHVMIGKTYLGAVGLEDALRSNAVEVIASLRESGVRRICMFTGDRLSVAKRVGQTVGVDSIEAECLPEEKHEELKYLISKGHRTLVVGDGINDGPILATADVGVAMGLTGSDIATNSAGVALMNDDLRHIPFLLDLARRGKGIVGQNIAASLVLALIGLALAATGQIDIYVTPFYQAVAYIFVIANSLRLVRFGEDFADEEQRRLAEEESRKAKPRRKAREQRATQAG
jgi:heavy metal translocating P-type ATPase